MFSFGWCLLKSFHWYSKLNGLLSYNSDLRVLLMDSNLLSDICIENSFCQFVVCLFIFLNIISWWAAILSFNEIQFIIFFFYGSCFWFIWEELYLSQGQKVLLIYFVLEVSYLSLQFISSFVYPEGISVKVLFCLVLFFAYGCSVVSALCIGRWSFFQWITLVLLSKVNWICTRGSFLAFVLFQ